jgi:hypothetical protein
VVLTCIVDWTVETKYELLKTLWSLIFLDLTSSDVNEISELCLIFVPTVDAVDVTARELLFTDLIERIDFVPIAELEMLLIVWLVQGVSDETRQTELLEIPVVSLNRHYLLH